MNLYTLRGVVKSACLIFALFFLCRRSSAQSNLSYVDPTIGGVGILLEPTRPTVQIPNGMVRVFPFRKDQLDDQIKYFPLTTASHRQSNLFGIMPYSGAINSSTWKAAFTYDQEKITPYSYSSLLEDNNIAIRFSPGVHSEYFKFKYGNDQDRYIRLSIIIKKERLILAVSAPLAALKM